MKAAWEKVGRATLIAHTLLVEGQKYTVDTLHLPPEPIRPENTVVKRNENTTIFYQRDAYLSNFFPSEMSVKNSIYNCVEQYYCAEMAQKFNDQAFLSKILHSSNPSEMKFLAGNIDNFVLNKWEKVEKARLFKDTDTTK